MYATFGAISFLLLWVSTSSHSACDPDDLQCLLRHDSRDIRLVVSKPKENATLPCNAFVSGKVSKAEWWFGRRSKLVGVWTDISPQAKFEQYNVSSDSSLLVYDVNRDLVEEYECLIHYHNGSNASSFVLLRLDFLFFYEGPILSTVFWGSCLTSLIFCVSSFILNLLWIGVRKVSLWWINRTERLSRVRSMLEAMEKYKSRQMDSLHDNYQKRVNAIRENYHQQVDEIRTSYSRQADRFRDYRQAQMETMTQHLDNIKDNYNQQLTRIRDYGSRRADRLVESYERQLNRIRTFTLQNRLKLMRQYKIKQNIINQLLENITYANQPSIPDSKDIHEILDLRNPGLPRSEFSCSASFYSLPDLTSDVFENHRFPLVDFKQFRHSINERHSSAKPSTSEVCSSSKAACCDVNAGNESSSITPLLKHHRRKSSNLRTVSSFNDCREQQQ